MSDRISAIRRTANELFSEEGGKGERVQVRVDKGSPLPIYIARSFPSGCLTALIRSVRISDLPANYRKPKIKGVAIQWMEAGTKAGEPFDIILELTQSDAADIFVVFVSRLCEVAEDCRTPKQAVQRTLAQIELWKNFFAGAAAGALSENRQTGLFGELTFINAVIHAGAAVEIPVIAWTGCSATNQDFEFGNIAVEVKSTTSADLNEVAITNVRQLDATGVERLYLSRLAFDVRIGEGQTLVSLVSGLRKTVVEKAPFLQVAFEEKLLSAGYQDRHAEEYSARAYSLRQHLAYRVEGEFPRLEESSLPPGVSSVKYRISLHGFDQYREDPEEILQRICKESA